MWLFPHFMKEPAKTGLIYRMSATEGSNTHKEEKLEASCWVTIYLLRIYVADDFIANAEADIINYKQSKTMYAVFYLEKL